MENCTHCLAAMIRECNPLQINLPDTSLRSMTDAADSVNNNEVWDSLLQMPLILTPQERFRVTIDDDPVAERASLFVIHDGLQKHTYGAAA